MSGWSNQRAARKVALGYLVVVIVVFAAVAVVLAVLDGPDASFAPVVAVGVTLPTSLVIVLLPEMGEPWNGIAGSAALVGAALFQAWLLWLFFRGRRGLAQ
ncbi:SCO4225 family membrane protein [Actinokineospora iranica]|uniref:Uncharacterized protein n=1 Tax=Actinokineospora iranica TaxID=1271860 RepID=A0A1G6VFJ7_9PSEU|nr:hypothetical protein [Actinokineospora iranica]SDD52422.1 hypothetical protein SAMN05216174_112119 [Actinokineospora iranica]